MSPRDPLLTAAELEQRLVEVPKWRFIDGRLHREFTFVDFDAAFAFMGRVATIANDLDHHPDWCNSWNRVIVDITSHDSGGPTDRCFRLARAIDELVDR